MIWVQVQLHSFFMWISSWPKIICWKGFSFHIKQSWHLCGKSTDHICMGLFRDWILSLIGICYVEASLIPGLVNSPKFRSQGHSSQLFKLSSALGGEERQNTCERTNTALSWGANFSFKELLSDSGGQILLPSLCQLECHGAGLKCIPLALLACYCLQTMIMSEKKKIRVRSWGVQDRLI